MLAVLVRTGEVLAVAAAAALAAGAAGLWWLRRRVRRLLAAQGRRMLSRAGLPGWAGLSTDFPLTVDAWRLQAVRAAWRLVRARSQRSARAAPGPRDRVTGMSAGR
jgi:hypothetical protein